MTRAAVILCSLLALAGCDEELLEGKVKVFNIHSANVEGVTGVPDGYHTWSDLQDSMDLPEKVPFGIRDDLVNVAGSVEDVGCAKIPNTANMCFEEDDSTSCLPSELKELGLKVYKIDLDDIGAAIDVGFYPTAVEYLDEFGFNTDLSIEDAECSAIE